MAKVCVNLFIKLRVSRAWYRNRGVKMLHARMYRDPGGSVCLSVHPSITKRLRHYETNRYQNWSTGLCEGQQSTDFDPNVTAPLLHTPTSEPTKTNKFTIAFTNMKLCKYYQHHYKLDLNLLPITCPHMSLK